MWEHHPRVSFHMFPNQTLGNTRASRPTAHHRQTPSSEVFYGLFGCCTVSALGARMRALRLRSIHCWRLKIEEALGHKQGVNRMSECTTVAEIKLIHVLLFVHMPQRRRKNDWPLTPEHRANAEGEAWCSASAQATTHTPHPNASPLSTDWPGSGQVVVHRHQITPAPPPKPRVGGPFVETLTVSVLEPARPPLRLVPPEPTQRQ